MCLAFKAEVIGLKRNGKMAVYRQGRKTGEAMNLERAVVGDQVLVQQGMVVEKLSSAKPGPARR